MPVPSPYCGAVIYSCVMQTGLIILLVSPNSAFLFSVCDLFVSCLRGVRMVCCLWVVLCGFVSGVFGIGKGPGTCVLGPWLLRVLGKRYGVRCVSVGLALRRYGLPDGVQATLAP